MPHAWQRLQTEQFDVVVIGGGVIGAGAALDAATRGLSVALVEARDYASGHVSRSSKLFHGGLRYLEQLEFGLVREALRERELMLTTLAPHLVKPVPFLFPLTHRVWERPYIAAGIILYDSMGGAQVGARAEAPDPRGCAADGAGPQARRADRRHPVLRRAGRRRPAHDDRRPHRRALRRGGADLDAGGRLPPGGERVVRGAGRDVEDGRDAEVQGAVVINAPGCGPTRSRRCRGSAAGSGCAPPRACTSSCRATGSSARPAIILRTEKSVLFVIPWGTHWIIGTTDTDWNLDLAHPAATKADIDYILDHVNTVLVDAADPRRHRGRVRRVCVRCSRGRATRRRKLSREHAVARVAPGTDRHRRRQVHDLPRDGRGRGRCRRRGHPGADGRRRSPRRCRSSAPTGYFALVNQADRLGRAVRPAPVSRSSTCSTATARSIDEVLDAGAETPELLAAAHRTRRSTSRWRSCTRRRTRGRCISTTSSPGAPASRSSTRTGA